MSDQPPSVELVNVTRRYGDHAAVDRLSLLVYAGEYLCLLGPSGCGKTTTLRLVAGLDQPDSGRVAIEGADMTGVPAHRRHVNTVFQHYALFPHMSVRENVAYGLRVAGRPPDEIRARVERALTLVRLSDAGSRRPATLSGGQQQRVALARALVNDPAVLLLDEPLGALDAQLRSSMQDELKRLQESLGIAFVHVTHDQDEAMVLGDRIAVMRGGRIEQTGTAHELYDHPATPFVASFVGEQNAFPGLVTGSGLGLIASRWSLSASAAMPGVVAGREGVALVRPEDVSLTDTDPRVHLNAVRGTVTRILRLGDAIRTTVTMEDGHTVTARRQRNDATTLPEIGALVWCRWARDAVRVFDGAWPPGALGSQKTTARLRGGVLGAVQDLRQRGRGRRR